VCGQPAVKPAGVACCGVQFLPKSGRPNVAYRALHSRGVFQRSVTSVEARAAPTSVRSGRFVRATQKTASQATSAVPRLTAVSLHPGPPVSGLNPIVHRSRTRGVCQQQDHHAEHDMETSCRSKEDGASRAERTATNAPPIVLECTRRRRRRVTVQRAAKSAEDACRTSHLSALSRCIAKALAPGG
jgi:hypothetical protein